MGRFDIFNIILLIIMPSFAGAYTSDYLRTLKGDCSVKVGRIIVSTLFATIFSYGLGYDYFTTAGKSNPLMVVSFFLGLTGFELVQYMSTLNGIAGLAQALYNIWTPVNKLLTEINEFRKFKSLPTSERGASDHRDAEGGGGDSGEDKPDTMV